MNRAQSIIGVGAGLLSGMLWGLNNTFFSLGYTEFASLSVVLLLPLWCAAINDGCAALFLLATHVLRGTLRAIMVPGILSRGKVILLAAVLGGPVGQLAYYYGITLSGASYALAVTATYPIIGCILSWLFLRQRITVFMWVGIVFSVCGTITLGWQGNADLTDTFVYGFVASLVAAFCWGSEIVLAVYAMEKLEPDVAITLRECISGGIFCAGVLFLGGSNAWDIAAKLPSAGLGWMGLAGVAAAGSYFLYYYANKTVGCARGTATNSTFMLWGIIFNSLLGTTLSFGGMDYLGCGMILLGVLLVTIPWQWRRGRLLIIGEGNG